MPLENWQKLAWKILKDKSLFSNILDHPLINEASVVLGGNVCTEEGDLEFVSLLFCKLHKIRV